MLSIDPGYKNAGFAIISMETGKVIDTATIKTKLPYYEGIAEIATWIGQTIDTMDIDLVVYENAFSRGKLGKAIGTYEYIITQRGIYEIFKVAPSHMKKVITGSGKGKGKEGKRKIQRALKKRWNIDITGMTDHETDAIGHGYTYILDNYPEILGGGESEE